MYDFILFDLDGTLIDSREGIFLSLRHAFDDCGIKFDGDLTQFIGPSFVTSFPRLPATDAELTQKLALSYRAVYKAEGVYRCRLYNGIIDLLSSLKARGKTIALATSKPLVFANTILARKRIAKYFDYVGGSDPTACITEKEQVLSALTKHFSSKARTALVGDTIYDCLGAKSVGIDCIGVTYGFGNSDELRQHASIIASSVKELKKILSE